MSAERTGFIQAALISVAVVLVPLEAAGWTAPWQRATTLDSAEKEIARRYADVQQVTTGELEHVRLTGHLILLDVREPAEYAVSHLEGAIRVDPDAPADAVLAAVGPIAEDTPVVVYCSVGVRSSRLAERAQAALKSAGASSVANLRGGIFAWHDERRPLVDARGPTDAVHGFDAKWARLIQRRDAPVVIPE